MTAAPRRDVLTTGAASGSRRPTDAGAIADAHVRGWLAAYRGLVPDSILDGVLGRARTAQLASSSSWPRVTPA